MSHDGFLVLLHLCILCSFLLSIQHLWSDLISARDRVLYQSSDGPLHRTMGHPSLILSENENVVTVGPVSLWTLHLRKVYSKVNDCFLLGLLTETKFVPLLRVLLTRGFERGDLVAFRVAQKGELWTHWVRIPWLALLKSTFLWIFLREDSSVLWSTKR